MRRRLRVGISSFSPAMTKKNKSKSKEVRNSENWEFELALKIISFYWRYLKKSIKVLIIFYIFKTKLKFV